MLYKQPEHNQILISRGNALSASLPNRFSLCVWNCQKGKRPGWADDFRAITENCNLFLAQEVKCGPGTQALIDKSPLYWTIATSFFSLRGSHPIGIAAGAVAKPQAVSFNADVKEPIFKLPKMTMSSVYRIGPTALLAVNIHAINFTPLGTFKKNIQNAEDFLSAFKGPVIIAGDFNVWSQKRYRVLLDLAERLGLYEVPFRPDNRSRFLQKKVDFIFIRGLRVHDSRVVDFTSSDHKPLWADLELCEPAGANVDGVQIW